jgi:hypothetical protein
VSELSLTPPAQNEKEPLSTTAALDIARNGPVCKDLPPLHQPTNTTEQQPSEQQTAFSHSDGTSPFFKVRNGSTTSFIQPSQAALISAPQHQRQIRAKRVATKIIC